MTVYLLIFVLGLAAGCLSGVVGTGAGIILLPILVFQFGAQEAVPIMAVAGLMGNLAKIMSWWREVDLRGFLAYSIAGAVGAAGGAMTLLVLPPNTAEAALGILFLLIVPVRHFLAARGVKLGLVGLVISGALISFISGIVLTSGPMSIPAFAAYGLTKGALLSTEALSAFVVQLVKVGIFWWAGALPLASVLKGAAVGASIMLGAFVGKAVVQRMSARMFERALDLMLIVAGLSMLWAAFA
ncbi:hypothetical protein IZ6_11520 [Terrihabitans soli]|uniref:Probable membrane transporter protein n=1 Tax=Terrihabitans soli TaxID=708113 RepID=A0A6S6QR20_9HYPH|nr:sulfite exporter TauE/SafE family protein [Terrihabitans soli]BCJ90417.1 hypothetical protein IZ6_11520 [Terrihabitans soli]